MCNGVQMTPGNVLSTPLAVVLSAISIRSKRISVCWWWWSSFEPLHWGPASRFHLICSTAQPERRPLPVPAFECHQRLGPLSVAAFIWLWCWCLRQKSQQWWIAGKTDRPADGEVLTSWMDQTTVELWQSRWWAAAARKWRGSREPECTASRYLHSSSRSMFGQLLNRLSYSPPQPKIRCGVDGVYFQKKEISRL